MDIGNILTELRQEHAQLREAIIAIERLAANSGKRRGRPPAWMAALKSADAPKRRGRPAGSKNAEKRGPKIATDNTTYQAAESLSGRATTQTEPWIGPKKGGPGVSVEN